MSRHHNALLRAIIWFLLVVAIMFVANNADSECQPVKLNPGEGIDWNCRLFRRVTRNGVLYIERLRPDRTVIAIEAVDCSKAVYVADGGWLEVPMHIISGNVWCSTPRRKHGANATGQIARAGKPSDGAGTPNHAAH